MMDNSILFKVSANTIPNKLGSAITRTLNEGNKVKLNAMGGDAVNQVVKGLIIAQSFLSAEGKELKYKFYFETKYDANDNELTSIMCTVDFV